MGAATGWIFRPHPSTYFIHPTEQPLFALRFGGGDRGSAGDAAMQRRVAARLAPTSRSAGVFGENIN